MTKKRIGLVLVFLALLLVLLAAAPMPPSPDTIILKAQQTVTIYCNGDQLIVTPASKVQADVTCRVWVR